MNTITAHTDIIRVIIYMRSRSQIARFILIFVNYINIYFSILFYIITFFKKNYYTNKIKFFLIF